MKNTTSHIQAAEFEALVLRRLLCRQRGEREDAAAAARIAAAIAADPAYARLAEQLEQTWQGLELPPVGAAPSAAPQLLARLRGDELRWSLAPTWARAAAALALALGLGAGWGLGLGFEPGAPRTLAHQEPAKASATSSELPAQQAAASEIQLADLSANPLGDSLAEAFGAESGYDEPGFAESLWLAAEADPNGGEVW